MTIKEYEQAKAYMDNIDAALYVKALFDFLLENDKYYLTAGTHVITTEWPDYPKAVSVPKPLLNHLITAIEDFKQNEEKKMQEL